MPIPNPPGLKKSFTTPPFVLTTRTTITEHETEADAIAAATKRLKPSTSYTHRSSWRCDRPEDAVTTPSPEHVLAELWTTLERARTEYLRMPSRETVSAMQAAGLAFSKFIGPMKIEYGMAIAAGLPADGGRQPPIVCATEECFQPATYVERLPDRRCGAFVCGTCKEKRTADWLSLADLGWRG